MLKNLLIKLGIIKAPKKNDFLKKIIEELNKPEPSNVKIVKKPIKKAAAKKAPAKKKAAKKVN